MPTTLHLRRSPAPSTPIVVELPAVVSDEWVRDLVALISASAGPPGTAAPLPIAGTLGSGPLWMDLDRMTVVLHGREITLRRQEFLLLRVLLEHPDRALTRRQLLRLAWDDDAGSASRTVDVHVRRLRARLGSESRRLQTVRGHGYRFVSRATGALAAVG